MPVLLRESIYQARKLPRTDEILQGRSALLAPEDQALIEAVLIKGQSAVSLGKLLNVPAKTVRKRVHKLSRRLSSRAFLDAARALSYLAPSDARIARLRFCQGKSLGQIAKSQGITLYKLRRMLDRISAEIQSIRRFTKPARRKSRPSAPAFDMQNYQPEIMQ